MSWDIYGNSLLRGHCEVHPHVHEEYPCSICISEAREKKELEAQYNKYCAEQYEEYCRELQIEYLTGVDGEGI